jgi:hypothetical protein
MLRAGGDVSFMAIVLLLLVTPVQVSCCTVCIAFHFLYWSTTPLAAFHPVRPGCYVLLRGVEGPQAPHRQHVPAHRSGHVRCLPGDCTPLASMATLFASAVSPVSRAQWHSRSGAVWCAGCCPSGQPTCAPDARHPKQRRSSLTLRFVVSRSLSSHAVIRWPPAVVPGLILLLQAKCFSKPRPP